jgi:hypothetical protein
MRGRKECHVKPRKKGYVLALSSRKEFHPA